MGVRRPGPPRADLNVRKGESSKAVHVFIWSAMEKNQNERENRRKIVQVLLLPSTWRCPSVSMAEANGVLSPFANEDGIIVMNCSAGAG